MSNFNTTPVPTKVKSFADSYEPRTGVKSKRSAQQELFKETDDEETFELSCASASNGLKKPSRYEPRKLEVDVNLLTCDTKNGKKPWAFLVDKENSMEVHRRYNLRKHMHMRWCQKFDLPRKFNSDGMLVPKYDEIVPGWYCVLGDVHDVNKIYSSLRMLVNAGFFADNLVFHFRETSTSRETATATLRAIKFRHGLEDFVDLSDQKNTDESD
jgi:hypothetical protein